MKLKILILSLLTTTVATASGVSTQIKVELQNEISAVSVLTSKDVKYELQTLVKKCGMPLPGKPSTCGTLTTLKVQVKLAGCADKSELSYNVKSVGTKKVVVLTPINLHNPSSEVMDCALKSDHYTINLGSDSMTKENLEIIVGEYKAQKDVLAPK